MASRRISSPLSFLSFASAAFAFALAVMPSRAQTPALSVTPNPAPANKAFTLTLHGVATRCYSSFSRETVSVYGNRIDLSYTMETPIIDPPILMPLAEVDTTQIPVDPVCPVYVAGNTAPDLIRENAPLFNLPALKPGKYEVWATQVPTCVYSKPACMVKLMPVSAGTLEVTEQGGVTYLINPATTVAGTDFDLSLLSYDFNCGTGFDNLNASVVGTEITLTFLDHQKVGVLCPAIYKPYGPTFKMTGLKPGKYTVKAYRLPECYPCKMMGTTADAGVLTVTEKIAKKGWYLKEHKVLAGKAFDMQLLNDDVGNCQTSFSHQSTSMSQNNIYVSFLPENHPENICIMDLHPWGPTFSMQALKTGVYPIYVVQLLACEVTAPFCAVDRIAPQVSDTLVVAQSLSIRMSELRAKAPSVEMRGAHKDVAVFALPAGRSGEWHAELVSLDGRVLGEKRIAGEAGMQVEVPVGRAPANAVSLLRLTSPEGAQQFLPIVR